MTKHPYGKWLDKVQNPSQYLGEEINAVIKDAGLISCRMALCFPDIYKIGMSNLGVKILYSIINSHKDLWAERVFAVEGDLEDILRENAEPLRSLESHSPLCEFDILGFSISTELCYTEILNMLELGAVPLLAKDRKDADPFVIAGGPSVYNPEPIADFFDFFVLGEGEDVLPEICKKVGECRKAGIRRAEIIRQISAIKGVYVPSFYDISYDGAKVKSITKKDENLPNPAKVYIEDINDSPYPLDMIIPYGQPVFDRLSVEIDRGCTGGCRFCQAGITYRPVRERNPKKVLEIVEKGLAATGFDDVSLASLSSGDVGNIEPLVKLLMDKTEKDKVSLSLPSMRSGTLTDELIAEISRVRQTGFTITGEAGSERLRAVINKKISDEEIIDTARKVLRGGWRNLKLYFMIGLPTETDEDVESIVSLVKKIDALIENGKRFRKINVGVSQFVPKPFTAFQWVPMDSVEELLRKKIILIKAFKKMKAASLKGHEVEMSFIEGVFARGDRRLGAVIQKAFKKGCRLDGWSDKFRYDFWLDAFEESGIEPSDYTVREREQGETFPWEHIDIGVSRKYLFREYSLSRQEEITNDCRTDKCLACGLHKKHKRLEELIEPLERMKAESDNSDGKDAFRYRFAFRKVGLARYLSHLEIKTAFGRAVRRAGLPVAYSQGKHPHPKFHFGPAVSVGISSLCEFIDVDLTQEIATVELLDTMRDKFEKGLEFYDVSFLERKYSSIQASTLKTVFSIGFGPEAIYTPEDIQKALEGQKGVLASVAEPSDGCVALLRIETETPGILSKIRKGLPYFIAGNGITIEKSKVDMGVESITT